MKDIKTKLKQAQDFEYDMRENSKECVLFVDKRDGQWEPKITQLFSGRPRYTDDRVSPIVNQVAGEMANADFSLRCDPMGGQSTKEIARLYDGILRAIQNQSNADQIYKHASRHALKSGIAGWELVQDYADSDSFDQDLLLRPLYNYEERVWIDPYSLEQDNSDANWGVILEKVSKDEYEDKFPEGKCQPLHDSGSSEAYPHKPDSLTIGKAYYRKPQTREIILMSNGAVYEDNDDFKKIKDELAEYGITEVKRRKRDSFRFYVRYFDNGGWISKEEETVFSYLPIVTVYMNYSVSEGKRLYYGLVEKSLDQQRVHNYAFSREVEEVALAPRDKIAMTRKQAKGNEAQLSKLNTSMDPVLLYNVDEQAPPPFNLGGAQVNPALRTIVEGSANAINAVSGQFAANLGDNPGLQSGIAIERQIDRGNNGTAVYFDAMEVAIGYTGKVLVDAIPRVYDATRQVRILGEDGSQEMLTVNQTIIDQQSGQPVTLNDLSQGTYDVTCSMGAAYRNRQQESADTFIEVAKVYPQILDMGADIFMKNLPGVGFDQIGERSRQMLLQQGLIPEDQMTQEERQKAEMAAQQPPQPDPNMVLAEAEMVKGQADMLEQENKRMELELKSFDVQAKAQAQTDKLNSETQVNIAKVQQEQERIINDQQKMLNDFALKLTELEQKYSLELNKQVQQNLPN